MQAISRGRIDKKSQAGNESYSNDYEPTEGANDPFRWIKVIKKERIDDAKYRFTDSVREASKEIGDETVEKSLAYLKEVIK